tara:strand:+ start:2437 stop:3204 length:768 start_codon:yes stop_codon:yes gene_type:complete
MISDFIEILILSLVQGVSEFIPVSSSAHLYLISNIYEFNNSSLKIDISLHLGSLLAIIFYFRKDLIDFYKNKELATLIILGSLPLILFGFFIYKSGLINVFRDLKFISWTTLIFAIALYLSDRCKINKSFNNHLSLRNIFIIGVFQMLALLPGVSRSGIVITTGRFLNFDRVDSSKISFFLSIPALAGASVLGLKNMVIETFELNIFIILSIILSFIFSFFTIKYFLIYVKKFSLNIFVYYRLFLAFVLFIIAYS